MSYINKLIIAKEFRNKPTAAEDKLWKVIKDKQILGYKFRRQYVIAGFILDFYCPKLKLGIEVDGSIHNIQTNKNYDMTREDIIRQYNINIIRITNAEVENNILTALKRLKEYIKSIK
ncbi:MAG: endonuclease domain-containing protein [Candidatus Falkowbacteria bacterium]|nr:endonuclease domain-containing protein [Candidatus Falkowbacteria bacterium]